LTAMNALSWDDTGSGDCGLSADDWSAIDGYLTRLKAIQSDVSLYSELAEEGQTIAGLARIFGDIYVNCAGRLDVNADYSERKAYYDMALASFGDAIDNTGCSSDDLAASMRECVLIKIDYASNLDALADRITAFEEGLDLTLTLIANPDAYIEAVAGACVYLAQGYRDLHEAFAGQGVTGMEETDSWQTSIQFFVQAIADHTDNYAELGDGWEWETAYDLMSELDSDAYPPRT